MRTIDLSHALFDGMSGYPSDPKISIIRKKNISLDRVLLHKISMGTHAGTHLDVPAHVINGGKTLDDFPLSSFFGRAVKVNEITVNGIKNIEKNIEGIIYDIGWYKYYNDPVKFYGPNRPAIPQHLIELAIDIGIKFFGCDLPSVDASGSEKKPVHHALMEKNIIIYESLTNLGKLPLLKPFDFYGFPLSLDRLDGSPVRAVGIV